MKARETGPQKATNTREPVALGSVTALTGSWWYDGSFDAAFFTWIPPA